MKLRDMLTLTLGIRCFAKFLCRNSSVSHQKKCGLSFVLSLISACVTSAAFSSPADNNVCDLAARKAAAESGVPLSVLWAITRTETGRAQDGKLQPWPWTVNMEGKGHWFETENAAHAYAVKSFKHGARSFDIGCFQINFKWHGASFRSIEHMFDPLENARYAAAFLKRLFGESGDWSIAAGAYHSRTPEYANRYMARFEEIQKQHSDNLNVPINHGRATREFASANRAKRQNNYPLLKHSETSQSHGSLVPLQTGQARALFTIPGILEGS